ncbi:MAG TPA: hypothetical protein VF256_03635 [Streptosporangiaceae bacterium]
MVRQPAGQAGRGGPQSLGQRGVEDRAEDRRALLVWTALLNRTRFGRCVYAIGGNAEAARRAGINLGRIRVAAFCLCGLTGGITGIISASKPGVDTQQLQRWPVRALRGRGGGDRRHQRVRRPREDARRGAWRLVVGVIYNGLFLLGLGQPLRTCGPPRSCSPRWPLMPWPAGEACPHPAELGYRSPSWTSAPGRYLAAPR